MNYLGHIFLSNDDLELMHANLFGDFVKGRNLGMYDEEVRKGIILHREIDAFIGQHNEVKKLVRILSPALPKVAAVAVDIYFDHFLAKHWSKFHSVALGEFLDAFYSCQIDEEKYPNTSFINMLFYLKKEKWISEYIYLDGIDAACKGVSSRISFPNALVNGKEVMICNYEAVESVFFSFMTDAVAWNNSR